MVGFSLSSTLVKRAEKGVLVAFCGSSWERGVERLRTGHRATNHNQQVRRAIVPGAFLCVNLAVFAGATDDSVAAAALLGSLAPFFMPPPLVPRALNVERRGDARTPDRHGLWRVTWGVALRR